jgi:flagellar biosynthesis/type III secretory pathway protein FliH
MLSSDVFVSLDPVAPPRNAGTWRLDELELPEEGAVFDAASVSPFDVLAEVDTDVVLPRNRAPASADRIAEAFEHGRDEGVATATASERARIESAVAALEVVLSRTSADRARWRANAAGYLAALACAMTRHLVETTIDAHDGHVVELAQRAMEQFPADEPIKVRLSPPDIAAIRASSPALLQRQDITLIPEASVGRGGCLVEGQTYVIDGRVDVAIERMYRHMTAPTDA